MNDLSYCNCLFFKPKSEIDETQGQVSGLSPSGDCCTSINIASAACSPLPKARNPAFTQYSRPAERGTEPEAGHSRNCGGSTQVTTGLDFPRQDVRERSLHPKDQSIQARRAKPDQAGIVRVWATSAKWPEVPGSVSASEPHVSR
jgi:hypothetical protein